MITAKESVSRGDTVTSGLRSRHHSFMARVKTRDCRLTATSCHGLWKCMHANSDLLFKTQSRNEPCTFQAKDPMGVGFIDDELRVTIRKDFLGRVYELLQRAHVPFHAVNPLDSNNDAPRTIADRRLGIADCHQGVPEGVHAVMAERLLAQR